MSQGRRAGDQSSTAALSTRYSGTWSPPSMQTKESTFLSRTPGESVPSVPQSRSMLGFFSEPAKGVVVVVVVVVDVVPSLAHSYIHSRGKQRSVAGMLRRFQVDTFPGM